MQRDAQSNRVKALLTSVLAMMIMPVSALCQDMFGPQTVYTDFSVTEDSPTIHAWGYTSAPVASGFPYPVTHSYSSITRIVLPGGALASNTAWGGDYSPAISNVFIDVNLATAEGDALMETDHGAVCSAVGSFLTTVTSCAGCLAIFDTKDAYRKLADSGSPTGYKWGPTCVAPCTNLPFPLPPPISAVEPYLQCNSKLLLTPAGQRCNSKVCVGQNFEGTCR